MTKLEIFFIEYVAYLFVLRFPNFFVDVYLKIPDKFVYTDYPYRKYVMQWR
ncbi:unnamed protein product, partial [marine sediment metagenome]